MRNNNGLYVGHHVRDLGKKFKRALAKTTPKRKTSSLPSAPLKKLSPRTLTIKGAKSWVEMDHNLRMQFTRP
jgi:hypothetical protein